MNQKKFIYTALIGAMCFIAVSCGSKKKEENTNAVEVEKVKTITIAKQTINRTVEYPSTLNAFEENYMASATPGRISKIFVEVGSRVSKGQVLVQMDPTQYYQAEVQLQNVATNYKRMDTLDKVGSISKQAYDQIKTQYDVAKSNVDFLLENTKLLAPFNGIVSGKYYENGEMYSGAPNTPVGKAAILWLVQIDNLKAFVSVPESLFPLIKTGMDVKTICDIYPDNEFSGKVFRIHPTIDEVSRTFKVEIRVANGKNLLRPGMFCRVSFDLGQTQALIVPAYAVLKLQGSNERYVFIEENGKAKQITVNLGKRFDDQVEIISNEIHKGDKLIIEGQARLLDGVAVQVVQ